MTGYNRTQARDLNYRLYTYKKAQSDAAARRRYDEQIAGTREGLDAYISTGLATDDVIAAIRAEITRLEAERAAL